MFLQLIPWWLRNSNQNKKSEIKEIRSQMYLSFALASFHQNDIGTLTAKIYYDILWYMVYYTYYMIHTYISIKIYIHMTHIHDYIPYDISRYIMIYNDIGPFTANLCICLLRQFHQNHIALAVSPKITLAPSLQNVSTICSCMFSAPIQWFFQCYPTQHGPTSYHRP